MPLTDEQRALISGGSGDIQVYTQSNIDRMLAGPDVVPPDFSWLGDIFGSIAGQASTASGASTYLQEVSAALAQEQFSFSKTQWADQLAQWNQQFGFSKDQFDTSTQLQRDQMAENALQFQATLGFQQKGQDQAWDQFLQTFSFQQEQFGFAKESFSDQLDFSKLQFEEQMGFSYDQLEQQLGMQANQLSFERERLAESASQFAASLGLQQESLGIQRESLGIQRELGLGQLELGKGQLALGKLAEAHDYELAKGGLALSRQQQSFFEKTTNTQMLMEAAGLAASPTGAIQLAYMARNAGAPSGAIADIFSNLPFVQAALRGETLPGFGVPEQLGGAGGSASVTADMDTNALVNAALGPEGGGSSPSSGGGAGTIATGDSTAAAPESLVELLKGLETMSKEELSNIGLTYNAAQGRFYAGERQINRQTNLSAYQLVNGLVEKQGTQTATETPTPAAASTATASTTNVFQRGLGITLPSTTSITQEMWGGMKDSEKLFLGALYQSETGVPIEQVLGDIQKSFIPTTQATRLSF